MVVKQDKGRGVAVVDRKKYIEKCINLLHTTSFIWLGHDPTKAIEGKIERSIRKIKNNLPKKEYSRLYPTGSSPGKLYGTVKWYNLNGSSGCDLPLRPIISNVRTASYLPGKTPFSIKQITIHSQ